MSSRRSRAFAGAATVVAVTTWGLLVAGPAAASPAGSAGPHTEVAARQAPILQAGWFADLDDAPTAGTLEAQVQFRVPTVRCPATANTADFISLYVNGENPAVEFAPSGSLSVRIACSAGTPTFTTTVRQSGDPSGGATGTAAAGDLLRLRVTSAANGTQAVLSDLTAGTTLRQRGTRFTALDSAQVSAQAGDGTGSRYPRFRTVTFTQALVRGVPWGTQPGYAFSGPTGTDSDPLQPGPFSADGTSFTATWTPPTG